MNADFRRYYHLGLAQAIWIEEWPPTEVRDCILGLPEESAFQRAHNHGHTTLHELLAQVRDATVTTAHGYRLEGAPKPYRRPGQPEQDGDQQALDPTNPEDAPAIRAFFGNPR